MQPELKTLPDMQVDNLYHTSVIFAVEKANKLMNDGSMAAATGNQMEFFIGAHRAYSTS